MASVTDNYFTDNIPDNLPVGWVRPDAPDWIAACNLHYLYGLPRPAAMYWGGFSASNAKNNPNYFDTKKIPVAYVQALEIDLKSIKQKGLIGLQQINAKLSGIVLAKGVKSEFAPLVKEFRENSKLMFQMAGGAFVTKTQHSGDKDNPLNGEVKVIFSYGNSDNGNSPDSTDEND